MLTRRDGLKSLGFFATYALLGELVPGAQAFVGDTTVRRWVERHQALTRDLKSGKMNQLGWMESVAQLSTEVDPAQLFATLKAMPGTAQSGRFPYDPSRRSIEFLDGDGKPTSVGYHLAIVTLAENQLLPPHAHRHVAAVNLIVEGSVRVRTWDHVADTDGALVIRPSSDRICEVGASSSTTAAKDNIHWFAPRSKQAVMVDVAIGGVGIGSEEFEIFPVDVIEGAQDAKGNIVAPIMGWAESGKKYTADM